MLDKPPASTEPLTVSSYWFMRSQLGLPIDDGKNFLTQHLSDPKVVSTNEGSGNWPWVCAAALKKWDWVAEALESEKHPPNGVGNREYGAMFYGGPHLAAKLDLLNNAIKLGEPVAALLASNIKAMLCGSALSALPTPINTLNQKLFEGPKSGAGNSNWYGGCSCTLPAPRQTPDILTDFVAAILTWAIDLRPRQFKHKFDEANPNVYALWPMQAVQNTMGADFGTTIPAARFALTDELRNVIKLLWSTAFSALHLTPILQGIGEWRPAEPITIYRSTSGVASYGPGRGHFKPTVLYRDISNVGVGNLCMPQRWAKEHASLGEVKENGNQVICDADGKSYAMQLPDGPLLYKIHWGPGRLDVESPGNNIVIPGVAVNSNPATITTAGAFNPPVAPIPASVQSPVDGAWYARMEQMVTEIHSKLGIPNG